jgi:hypothetical protein
MRAITSATCWLSLTGNGSKLQSSPQPSTSPSTQEGGESWLEMPLPQGVQRIYALACG